MLKVISHSWPDYPEYCFKLGDCEIRVRLYKGVSAQEAFHIPGRMLTDYQVQEILRKNGAGSEKITSDHITLPDHSDVLIIWTREFKKIFQKDIGPVFESQSRLVWLKPSLPRSLGLTKTRHFFNRSSCFLGPPMPRQGSRQGRRSRVRFGSDSA
jgi:hypothetical protein